MCAGLGFAMTIGDWLMESDRPRSRRNRSKDDKDGGGGGALGMILYVSDSAKIKLSRRVFATAK